MRHQEETLTSSFARNVSFGVTGGISAYVMSTKILCTGQIRCLKALTREQPVFWVLQTTKLQTSVLAKLDEYGPQRENTCPPVFGNNKAAAQTVRI